MRSPRRNQRKDSPFTKDQEVWVILEYGKLNNITLVRRSYRVHFKIQAKKVPYFNAFKRLVTRFLSSKGQVRPQVPPGPPPISQDTVGLVKDFFMRQRRSKKPVSLISAASSLNLSKTTIWRVVRLKLKWFPYKAKLVQPLTEQHKAGRVSACNFFLLQDITWFDKVIWSDEKWFVRRTRPNKQNERYWEPFDPEIEVDCRVQGDEKVMCWCGLINGKIIIHWFNKNESVNGATYLKMLKTAVWPKVRAVATRNQYWFQQDGATPHTTIPVRGWLQEKFGDRVISRWMAHPWPAKSPDLSPLDFWFWGVAMTELRRVPPMTINQLKQTVEDFASSVDPDEIGRVVRSVQVRARACIGADGGAFEYRLKKDLREE